MAEEILLITPPDETGTDALKRYRYQAHVAFPFCLRCLQGDGVISVVMEHFEDVLVQYADHWDFIQIKTRNPDLGPWKLKDAINEGGGLRSLIRTYHVVKGHPGIYSLYLEGAIGKDDRLNELVPPPHTSSEDLIDLVAKALGISQELCASFLSQVVVIPNQPHRDFIGARNTRMLGAVAPQIPNGELEGLYEACVDELFRAMSEEPLWEQLADFVEGRTDLSDELARQIDAKRFTKPRLTQLLGAVTTGPYPLLRRITDSQQARPTDLEFKLIAGGATDSIVDDAKTLRAQASIRVAELSSSTLYPMNDRLEDVSVRLTTLSNSIIQPYVGQTNPARDAWRDLLERLVSESASVDPNRLFRQDPYLLMGMVCELTDECRIMWGVPIA